MTVQKLKLLATIVRRLPDPVFFHSHGIQHWQGFIRAADLIPDISFGPNARTPNTRKAVYKSVAESLSNTDCIENTFHLKNLGIVFNAKSVRSVREGKRKIGKENVGFVELEVMLPDFEMHGILNGGHTYTIAINAIEKGDIPLHQHVPFSIRTGVPNDWLPEIAGGMNTAMQVQDMSLDDLAGAFEWIKEELAGTPYYEKINWSENDKGVYDARDIVSVLACLDIETYPNKRQSKGVPISAYEKKSLVLDDFRKDFASNKGVRYRKLRPILKDALVLFDLISYEFKKTHNKGDGDKRGRAGALAICDYREAPKKPYEFIFLGKNADTRLQTGALYPLFGAFRWMVEAKPNDNNYRWRGGFANVKKRWEQAGPDLVRKTVEKAKETNLNANAIGKSRTHWENLHQTVGWYDLQAQADAAA